ncbi:hypothetical protein SASPL_136387 [Salvia splendens]|uniref:Uncharacterized protein n=1 Tax=Salvia splendens TaxID=180675 RepID=A0A8X8ZGK7_SALSN|nr:uncharacterized protein LOC121761797 [Salvia splendens]KAG6404147.1 hypothetical protein SASPL_136387 [Salvia splendens]
MKQARNVATMVGCKISKISTDRAMFRRTRLRPLVLQQIAAVRTWRLPARSPKDTSSKKSLLLEEKPLENNSVIVATVIGNTYGLKVSTKPKLHPQLEDGHDDDQCRMITQGSPSFRIFFEDAARDAHLQQFDQYEGSKDTYSKEEEGRVQKKVKRERNMKRRIKNVILRKEFCEESKRERPYV